MIGAARLVAAACLLIAIEATRAHSQPDPASANAILPGCESFFTSPRNDLQEGQCAYEVRAAAATTAVLGRVCAPPGAT
jgi:hypothetical protein